MAAAAIDEPVELGVDARPLVDPVAKRRAPFPNERLLRPTPSTWGAIRSTLLRGIGSGSASGSPGVAETLTVPRTVEWSLHWKM